MPRARTSSESRKMIRGIIKSVVEGAIKRFTASGRPDETISDREYFQHYGLTSRPRAGAEAIIIREGNHFLMIASDDRRYRISLEEGEVALYTDEGDKVHLKRGQILIHSGGKIAAEAPEIDATASAKIVAIAPEIDATATAKIKANAPEIEVTATVKVSVTAPEIDLTAATAVKVVTPMAYLGAAAGHQPLKKADNSNTVNVVAT